MSYKYIYNYPIVIYDFETTGFCSVNDDIVEIAASTFSSRCKDIFHHYVNTELVIENEHIHGINNNFLMKTVTLTRRDILELFIDFVEKAKSEENGVFLLAHNNFQFDFKFLEVLFKKEGLTMPPDWYYIDSLSQLRHIYPKLKSHSQGNMYKYAFNTDFENQHTAVGDIKALYKLYIHLVAKKLSEEDYQRLLLKNDGFMRANTTNDDFFEQSICLLDLNKTVTNMLKRSRIDTLNNLLKVYRRDKDGFINFLIKYVRIKSKWSYNKINSWAIFLDFIKD